MVYYMVSCFFDTILFQSHGLMEEDERKFCMKGWKVAGIKEAVQKGLAGLPNLDPFSDIDAVTESDADLYSQVVSVNKIQESSKYVSNFFQFILTAKVMTNGLRKRGY